MDTTSNLDQLGFSMTTYHTWSVTGGVPIAFTFTQGQATEDYVTSKF